MEATKQMILWEIRRRYLLVCRDVKSLEPVGRDDNWFDYTDKTTPTTVKQIDEIVRQFQELKKFVDEVQKISQ